MTDLIDTTEMYLRTILELEEEGITPLRARIVERLEHSGPTVSQTVARMERDGLVQVAADRHLELTARGRELAVAVLRKHRLAERLLSDVIGLDWAYVHDEACRWEHVMSDKVEARLRELLDDPTVTPYGTPIPPHPSEPGGAGWGERLGLDGLPLSELVDGTAELQTVRVTSLAEAIQTDPVLLDQLFSAGIRPGATITVRPVENTEFVRVEAAGTDALEIAREAAAHVRVSTLR
ncbi:DtxR family Mn-dependent transcriptional regulator [Micrococcus cohnii]|uniref:DtxR family Mn-dependent transcriptional regulator n=3 Tax=Micrococcus TaxID=1269 RepID=A0A7W7DWF0_9MICC|nr:metal-dependent transcriptional regulator [Micrococcus cohnii]MBB4734522.1 DtxR family Mn-dependent transcriptional regulator [Micrococcus cohnii]